MHAVTYINLQNIMLDTKGHMLHVYLCAISGQQIYEDRKYISYLGMKGLGRSEK